MKKIQALLAFSLMMSLSAVSAQAQPAPQMEPAPNQAAAQQGNYSDQQLQAFAKAVLEVSKVAQAYQPKLAKATQPEQAQKVQMEANTEMVKVVQQQGLQPEQYNQMHQAVQQDEAMLQKVQSYIQTYQQ